MKRVLIISPYFPPSNAADMQRIRISLPYFTDFEWEAEVVCVKEKHSEMVKDSLLMESIPSQIIIHQVEALSKKWTGKVGLGSLALRSLWYYKKYVDSLLKNHKFDLIYFSTTQFPVCILGAYWKKKWGIPYVIDMQDPWHSEYYQNKPKNERPKKYWFSYRLNKYLEPIAMKKADGLISVSEGYIESLRNRYSNLKEVPASSITFGVSETDLVIANEKEPYTYPLRHDKVSITYIGVVGHIMQKSLTVLFNALKTLKNRDFELYDTFQFYFIGTSYSKDGQPTVTPLARLHGVVDIVFEQVERISFYQTLKTLQIAKGLVIIGTDDPNYTASKAYPYILSRKPLLALLHKESNAVQVIKDCNAGSTITLDTPEEFAYLAIKAYLESVVQGKKPETNWEVFESYTAKEMTRRQCELFDQVLRRRVER